MFILAAELLLFWLITLYSIYKVISDAEIAAEEDVEYIRLKGIKNAQMHQSRR